MPRHRLERALVLRQSPLRPLKGNAEGTARVRSDDPNGAIARRHASRVEPESEGLAEFPFRIDTHQSAIVLIDHPHLIGCNSYGDGPLADANLPSDSLAGRGIDPAEGSVIGVSDPDDRLVGG